VRRAALERCEQPANAQFPMLPPDTDCDEVCSADQPGGEEATATANALGTPPGSPKQVGTAINALGRG
jgi:hypothetical protein